MVPVYTFDRTFRAYGGGETAAKAAAVNTRIAPHHLPRNAKTLCHQRIGRLIKNDG
jgi:hypothetical protein